MVRHAIFREIIGPHFLASVTRSNLACTCLGAFGVLHRTFAFVEANLELLHRLFAVDVLRLFGARGHETRRQVSDAHGGVSRVDMLTTGS